jgi:hypothetical protein
MMVMVMVMMPAVPPMMMVVMMMVMPVPPPAMMMVMMVGELRFTACPRLGVLRFVRHERGQGIGGPDREAPDSLPPARPRSIAPASRPGRRRLRSERPLRRVDRPVSCP